MSRRLPARSMKSFTELFGAMALALLTTLLSVAAPAPAGAATAASHKTISNVATIEWSFAGMPHVLSSNQVDLDVTLPETVELTTYHLNAASPTLNVALAAASCTTTGGSTVGFSFDGVLAGIDPAAAPITPTSEIRAGEPLVIEIDRPGANTNSNVADKLSVVITTTEGDSETLTLVENGPDTGRFFGIIPTVPSPPPGQSGDCELAVRPGDTLTLSALDHPNSAALASSEFRVLVDPFGMAFDSTNGAPVAGTRVTIVDADTGQPAQVFGEDGKASFPSTVTVGTSVSDSAGRVYQFPDGEYRFPMMRPGRYRLRVEPPAPYLAPSTVPATELAGLKRPDGAPFAIGPASYGGVLFLASALPVQTDIPLDKPAAPLVLAKTASVAVAEPGDTVLYRVTITNPGSGGATGAVVLTDLIPNQMRLRLGTVRVDGQAVAPSVSNGGRLVTVAVHSLAASASAVVTYALEVRPDAREGDALNHAEASDSRGTRSNPAEAAVRIVHETISGRMTIIGRVTDGGCTADPAAAAGIRGVRIMLEDGSYAVTDEEGRYHFEGVKPGLHVVQLDDLTLPADRSAVDCSRDPRSGGRAFSRFVDGRGGSLQ
ncbi:MAG: hypothetical protein ACM3YM_01820, partial [Sphingomonadales bacterium]